MNKKIIDINTDMINNRISPFDLNSKKSVKNQFSPKVAMVEEFIQLSSKVGSIQGARNFDFDIKNMYIQDDSIEE